MAVENRIVKIIVPVVLPILALMSACSSNAGDKHFDPVSPGLCQMEGASSQTSGGRYQWGYFIGKIPETHDSIEFVPAREGDFHANVRKFLEDGPCYNCIKVANISVDPVGNTLSCDISLIHPFPGLDRFTGFDVRAVVITDASLYFTYFEKFVPCSGQGDFTLINPDGYTHFWNTQDFPPGSGAFPVHEYSKGKFASDQPFNSTVNPYIEFSENPRMHFPAGGTISRHFIFNLKPGALKFGYAVDCSWEPPIHEPVENILTDFSPSANALEPIITGYEFNGTLYETPGSECELIVHTADHQAWHNDSFGGIDAPDIWYGIITNDSTVICSGSPFWFENELHFTLVNELGASPGTYAALLRLDDGSEDPWLGHVNYSWKLIRIKIEEKPNPEFGGLVVHTAPGPPGPGGDPGAANMFLLNMDTQEDTQITGFIGVGILIGDPGINPTGTHMLLPYGGTPFYFNVHVFEIGGDDWSVTPPDTCDGAADFHPDGEHLLIATGDSLDKLTDLYSCKYDGSERTLITTAPKAIRDPKWDPEGKRIAAVMDTGTSDPLQASVFVYDVDAETWTEMVPAPGDDERPSWSPVKINGSYFIAFDSNREDQYDPDRDICIMNPDANAMIGQIDVGQGEMHPTWSPDGLSIMFSMETTDDIEFFIYVIETGELIQVTDDDTWDYSPSWSWGW